MVQSSVSFQADDCSFFPQKCYAVGLFFYSLGNICTLKCYSECLFVWFFPSMYQS